MATRMPFTVSTAVQRLCSMAIMKLAPLRASNPVDGRAGVVEAASDFGSVAIRNIRLAQKTKKAPIQFVPRAVHPSLGSFTPSPKDPFVAIRGLLTRFSFPEVGISL
jgi:hypothetical protein